MKNNLLRLGKVLLFIIGMLQNLMAQITNEEDTYVIDGDTIPIHFIKSKIQSEHVRFERDSLDRRRWIYTRNTHYKYIVLKNNICEAKSISLGKYHEINQKGFDGGAIVYDSITVIPDSIHLKNNIDCKCGEIVY